MLHIDMTLEDVRLIATRDEKSWKGHLLALPTADTEKIEWSDCELGAILALAAGTCEETDTVANGPLYAIAEPCFKDLDIKFRIIP